MKSSADITDLRITVLCRQGINDEISGRCTTIMSASTIEWSDGKSVLIIVTIF
jgi:hypothetical protein